METADQHVVFPVFQFGGTQVNPGLTPANRAFAGSPAWSLALWFVTEDDDLDGITPLAWIATGGVPGAVAASAQRTAGMWR